MSTSADNQSALTSPTQYGLPIRLSPRKSTAEAAHILFDDPAAKTIWDQLKTGWVHGMTINADGLRSISVTTTVQPLRNGFFLPHSEDPSLAAWQAQLSLDLPTQDCDFVTILLNDLQKTQYHPQHWPESFREDELYLSLIGCPEGEERWRTSEAFQWSLPGQKANREGDGASCPAIRCALTFSAGPISRLALSSERLAREVPQSQHVNALPRCSYFGNPRVLTIDGDGRTGLSLSNDLWTAYFQGLGDIVFRPRRMEEANGYVLVQPDNWVGRKNTYTQPGQIQLSGLSDEIPEGTQLLYTLQAKSPSPNGDESSEWCHAENVSSQLMKLSEQEFGHLLNNLTDSDGSPLDLDAGGFVSDLEYSECPLGIWANKSWKGRFTLQTGEDQYRPFDFGLSVTAVNPSRERGSLTDRPQG